jgi:hypothetical protein
MPATSVFHRCLGADPGLTPEVGDPIVDHPQPVVSETQQLQSQKARYFQDLVLATHPFERRGLAVEH